MRPIFIIFLFIVISPLHAHGAGIVINEIAWMGTLPKVGESPQAAANNEWIELYNSGDSRVLLDGWKIVAEDNAPDIALSGAITARGYFLLERSSDNVVPAISADLIYPYKNNALSNSGERLFLKDASGAVIDEVDAHLGWPAGDNDTKETMQRSENKWITATGTPRALNYSVQVAASIPPSSSPASPQNSPSVDVSSSHNGSQISFVVPSISAYAGEDLIATVGSSVEFLGNALGLKNEPLENARFWWNFGDGESAEGRAVSHIFQAPGRYTVGLHVSSGGYAASDYTMAEIVLNQVEITSVLEGESGFIRLANPASNMVDIGYWSIENSNGKKFIILPKTKIAAKSEIALNQSITGLWQKDNFYPLTVRYPNATVAFKYSPAPSNKNIGINSVTKTSTASTSEAKKIFTNISNVSYEENKNVQLKNAEDPVKDATVKPEKDNFAQILPRILNSSYIFFITAFVISFISGLGFILTKKLSKKWISPKF